MCRECYRLGPDELAYRQAARNIEAALHGGPFIPWRQRSFVESFQTHEDPRVRELARETIEYDRSLRDEQRRLTREDEEASEAMSFEAPPDVHADAGDGGDIPF